MILQEIQHQDIKWGHGERSGGSTDRWVRFGCAEKSRHSKAFSVTRELVSMLAGTAKTPDGSGAGTLHF
jgi:hypothetical protein